jgi:hypothetical protein
MNSYRWLAELKKVPGGTGVPPGFGGAMAAAAAMDASAFPIEAAVGVEVALEALFDARNVPDNLTQAFELQYPRVAADASLYEHYQEMLSRGDESLTGFLSGLKGKLAELEVMDKLQQAYPGCSFELADGATNAGWDILGTAPDGSEFLIQVKTGGAEYADSVARSMEAAPDSVFVVSTEIRDALLEGQPEAVRQLLDVEWLDFELSSDVSEGLAALGANIGIDVPDSIGDALPFLAEIILGIKLLTMRAAVSRDFSAAATDERSRIATMRALVLIGRFGVTSVLAFVGSAAGPVGSLTGIGISIPLNKAIKPHLTDIALQVMNLTKDDLFYLRNKLSIDGIGEAFGRRTGRVSTA